MGPRKRWALSFAVVLAALYVPLTRTCEPPLREAWFAMVTRPLAHDASGLAPPEGKMWLGATRPELPESLHGVYELEANLGRRLAIASFYRAWGDGAKHAFPRNVLDSLHEGGYLPMLTWEPWLNAFERFDDNPRGSLRLIARGDFDDYIRRFAREAVRYGRPLLLRPGHEPTNAWYGWAPDYGNSAADYRAFWARVHRIFSEEGARNVLFVWTPYGLEDHDWFPGAEHVDWIGFDLFNYGDLSEEEEWLDFYTLAKLYYDRYRELGPPLLVAETGTTSAGGSKVEWVRGMFHSLAAGNFPRIRALVLFDEPQGQTKTGLPIDWSLGEVPAIFERLREEPELLEPFTRSFFQPEGPR